jgi:hypothetical protein
LRELGVSPAPLSLLAGLIEAGKDSGATYSRSPTASRA